LGGQRQGGISTPTKRPIVLLFTGESGSDHGYQDAWLDDRPFSYTGEGQRGDMTFSRGNVAIRDHVKNGKTLHIFRQLDRGESATWAKLSVSVTTSYRVSIRMGNRAS
jgi:5-methylcytosine-specific restriction protein A